MTLTSGESGRACIPPGACAKHEDVLLYRQYLDMGQETANMGGQMYQL